MERRALFAVVMAFAPLAAVAQGTAQMSGVPLHLIVPFGAATTTDIVSRQVGAAMSEALRQPVVVENKAGAGGLIGSDLVAKAVPDGRTILMGTVGTHAINATLYKKLPYDPIKDFAPLGFVGYTPTLLVVSAQSPIRNLAELTAAANRPNGVTFASAGNGTSGHLAGELLNARVGGKMIHVPYNQGGQAMLDVMTGKVDFMFYHPAAVLPQMKAGKLRALAASSAKRSAAASDIATLQEQGVADFDLVAWFMMYAPSKTQSAELTRLRAALQSALAKPEVANKLTELGIESRTIAIDDLANFSSLEIKRWAEAVKRSGATVD